VSVHGGGASFTELVVREAHGVALKASMLARVEVAAATITGCGTGIVAREGACVTVRGGAIDAVQPAHAGKDEMRHGPVRIELQDVSIPEGPALKVGQGSSIRLNGQEVRPSKAEEGT